MIKKIYLLSLLLIAFIASIAIASPMNITPNPLPTQNNITENINYLDAAAKKTPIQKSSVQPAMMQSDKPTLPTLSIPLPPPANPSTTFSPPINKQAVAASNKAAENEKAEAFQKENEKQDRQSQANLVNKLMDLNYSIKTPPKQLYESKNSINNKHLPPVYFKSYYLYLAFKAIDNNNLNDLRAVLARFDFINGQNKDGDTLLIHATEVDSLNAARVLLAKGAYVNGLNNRGRTALHYAATIGNTDIIKLLFTMGADSSIMDDKGMTALNYAIINPFR